MTRNEYGLAIPAAQKLKSGEWYRRVKREILADPRTYEDHPRFPPKRMAGMYGVHQTTYARWKAEANENL